MNHTLHCECKDQLDQWKQNYTTLSKNYKENTINFKKEIERILSTWRIEDQFGYARFMSEELKKENEELKKKNSDLGWTIASLRGEC